MTKHEFISELREQLSGLPEQDIEERLDFYSEIIDDKMEEGISEEEAIRQIGSVKDIASQVIADTPLTKIVKHKIKKKRKLGAWEIVLLALGSPIWLSLLVAAFAIVIAAYAVLWSLIASIWAIFAALVACGVGGVAGGVLFIVLGKTFSGIAAIGAAIFCSGLSIFAFFGCLAATKGTALLTKKIALGIKKCFVRKERS